MKTKERILKTKLRGAVLLLVMTVMFMLMIILMATLAVVSTSNKKAYVKFEENQAYYSAASALEVFWGGENGTSGFMKDEKYAAMSPNGSVLGTVDVDGNLVAMTQGRSIEMELYKLEALYSLNTTQYINKVMGAPYQLDVTLQNNFIPNALGDNLTYSNQYTLPSNPKTEVAFYVEFPLIANPSSPANSYGEYADINPLNPNPAAPVNDQPLQKAAIKMEVLSRLYNMAGVETNDLIDFLNDDLPVGDPDRVKAPSAIADDADEYKIDLTKLAAAVKNGDRSRDYFAVRITSESVLMGVKGTASVEMITTIPNEAVPKSDTAIKSFGFTDDAGAGYNAIGGATGLADVKIGKGRTAGLVYSEGNISMASTGKITMEKYTNATNTESKAHVVAKSWLIINNDMNFDIQGEDAFLYGYRGINLQGNMNTGGKNVHLISNGVLKYRNGYTIPGNVVVRQLGKADTFNPNVTFSVTQGTYVHDLYLDDLQATGYSGTLTRFGSNTNFQPVGNSGTIYVNNLYVNFPAAKASSAPTGTMNNGSDAIGFNPADNSFGFYDYWNSGEVGSNTSPVGIKTDSGNKWVINLPMFAHDTGGGKVQKIVFSGNIYFRNYNGTASPDDDYYTALPWEGPGGTGGVKDNFLFFAANSFVDAGALLNGSDADAYYTFNTMRLLNNNGDLVYRAANAAPPPGEHANALDINTDIYNAKTIDAALIGGYGYANTLASGAPEIKVNVTSPQDHSYAFDTETGYIYLRMPFSVGASTNSLALKFDTPMSLYKEFMDLSRDPNVKFNITDQPIDKNGDGYLTSRPDEVNDDVTNPTFDVLGYGSLEGRYLGAYTKTTAGEYVLEEPDDYKQSTTDGLGNPNQLFGYLSTHIVGGREWGISDLIISTEDKGSPPSGWVFDDSSVLETTHANPPPDPIMSIRDFPSTPPRPEVVPGRISVGYTKYIDANGSTLSSNGITFSNLNNRSVVNIVDATVDGRSILLQPYQNPYDPNAKPTIVGTYLVDGDKEVTFYIPGGLGTVQLGINQTQAFNIISSTHVKNFNISTQITKNQFNDSFNLAFYRYVTTLSGLTNNNSLKLGSNERNADYSSKITLYIGEGTNVELDSGIIDGTVYGPLSSFSTVADNPTKMNSIFNGTGMEQQPTAVIGTLICGSLSFSNNTQIVFLPPEPDDPSNPGLPNFTWDATVYKANASGS
ncbi:MAG: hypothetical protein LBL87_04525 [Ruminococcus sp.]|nr:hypothetical protein [Ruminococcus sp.]